MSKELLDIAAKFDLTIIKTDYGTGHINDTHLAKNKNDELFILQRINNSVFLNPLAVINNISLILSHLIKKVIVRGGDTTREVLTIKNTLDGKEFYKTDDGNFYRAYNFIENTKTYDRTDNPKHFYNLATCFGRFYKDLEDFDPNKLTDTIPNFHNTKSRYNDFVKVLNENKVDRRKNVSKEIDFVLAREKDSSVIIDFLEKCELPMRATHNDTKLSNVLFDNKTDKAICVIDLDTVMSGSLLYDYGDAMRYGTNSAAEDEKNLNEVYCDLALFEAFTKGFLKEMHDVITDIEMELLPFSAKLITYENGIRFLGDYLAGDTYYKTKYSEHNLDRARTQFKLVSDMESKENEMRIICYNALKDAKKGII